MKGKEPKDFEVRWIEDFGEIGAGKVVEFIGKNQLVPMIVPAGAPSDENLGRMTVRGISLEDEDIYDGDLLLLRRDITKKDIGPHTICAVLIHSTGELVAKKVEYRGPADYVTLKASGGNIKDLYFPADEVEIRGIVMLFQRMPNEYGRFRRRTSPDDIPF